MKHTVIGQLEKHEGPHTIVELYPNDSEPTWHLCKNVEEFLAKGYNLHYEIMDYDGRIVTNQLMGIRDISI